MNLSIEDAKRRLPLRELAQSLGFTVPERDGQAVKCWFPDRHANGDQNHSFNIYRDAKSDERFKCFGCGAQGDAIDLLAEVRGLNHVEAVREFKLMAGAIKPEAVRPKEVSPKAKGLKLWPELRKGTNEELERLARLRGLDVHGLALAQGMGVLRFGRYCGGRDCWFVADNAGYGAEASLMDGKLFPKFKDPSKDKDLPERKRHFLGFKERGKNWPCGLLPEHSTPSAFPHLLLCEGAPDLLAGYHFAERFGALTWLPVAMLGRSCRILPEALPLFAGRHIRIVPHLDPDGGGFTAAEAWADELRQAGATVDFFKLPEGLRRKDGKPVKDLCDAANLPERGADRIADLFNP
jgi:hypothetical protein